MKPLIGIDLGTTYCRVAVMDGFTPRVLPNRAGARSTPSAVSVTEEDRWVVGEDARGRALSDPENTAYAVKRLLGRSWHAPEVRHAREHLGYPLVAGPRGDVRVSLRGRVHAVPELLATLLQELRVVAEDFVGEPVDRAVLTCPAYFDDQQRQALRDAARIAGLEIVCLLNEPTAAAVAYGYGRGEERTLAVYDLGGGTFDISIVRVSADGVFRVLGTAGDAYLGGEDFDDRITRWLVQDFEMRRGVDLRRSPIAVQRIKRAAEQAKRELSSGRVARVTVPLGDVGIAQGVPHLRRELTRERLERLTGDFRTRTLECCELAMRMAELPVRAIDEVILVGGMTRMPAIQSAVAEFFDREPTRRVHPEEVVAIGAAIRGTALAEDESGLELQDVTARTLGVLVAGGRSEAVIPINTGVPCRMTRRFSTHRDGQTRLSVIVLQGESERAEENELVGRLTLDGLREAPPGEVEIEVAFAIDEDGLFSVTATDLETGEAQQIEVTGQGGLEDAEIEALVDGSQNYLEERRTGHREERPARFRSVGSAVVPRLRDPEGERSDDDGYGHGNGA